LTSSSQCSIEPFGPTVNNFRLVKNAVFEKPLAARKKFQLTFCLVSVKVENLLSQGTSDFLRGERFGNCTKAELIVFQTRLEIGNQYMKEVVFRLAEMSNMSAPAHVAFKKFG